MFDFIDIALEFIFLGSVDSLSSKRMPMIFRVVLAAVLLAVCLGLFALLLIVGINMGSVMLITVAFFVLILFAVLVIPKIRRITKQTK